MLMFIENLAYALGGIALVIVLGIAFMISKWYRKVEQGKPWCETVLAAHVFIFQGPSFCR